MLDGLRQLFIEAKAKRMLKRATSILTKLDYEIVDTDQGSFTFAFKMREDSLVLFVADPTTLGSRIEATIGMPADLINLKLMSDLANIAYNNRCTISGLSHSGKQSAKLELVFCLGESFNRHSVAVGLSYLAQALNEMSDRLVSRVIITRNPRFDLSSFDNEHIPFFDPGLVGERKLYMYGDDWGAYISESANQNALGGYTAVEIDHDLDIICACRDFEQINDCSLAEVGGLVMLELARHRNNQAFSQPKEEVN